ncbi:putative quinol monooxygenase [Paenibacillus sp. JDR-2]|uniref:putative quinol monooxygenase n=1 Tax=Paenibacillus sp. (strain JDR-2) TaxID=324057 RepID=UPI0001663FE5|nr:putative quinol monooxygenase [Paenibacillus sp. JDR-2]ACT02611.1 Antibiotic biosynthesis monooxygenase [Paenibacillus sp. JDR-2]
MITIVAILKARAGNEQQLRDELLKVAVPSRAEGGCIDYILHNSPEHREQYVLYETWKDEDALQAHLASSHYQEYRRSAEAWLASREVYRLNRI